MSSTPTASPESAQMTAQSPTASRKEATHPAKKPKVAPFPFKPSFASVVQGFTTSSAHLANKPLPDLTDDLFGLDEEEQVHDPGEFW